MHLTAGTEASNGVSYKYFEYIFEKGIAISTVL